VSVGRDTVDTANRLGVGLMGDTIVVLRAYQRLGIQDAINLAAYLVVLSGITREDFERLRSAIEAT
jgi:hypothetical protein